MDRDDPMTQNAELYYTLVSQIPNRNKMVFFQINHQTGAISTTEQGEPSPTHTHTHTDRTDRQTGTWKLELTTVPAHCWEVCNLPISACNLAV